MKAEPYICACGNSMFVRYSGDDAIYCKQCGKAVPGNVRFKEEYAATL